MSRKTLLSTLDESECNFRNISQNRLQRIAKLQNLLQMNLSKSQKCRIYHKMNQSKLAKMRQIKNYKNISKEELLTTVLKSKQSHAKLYESKSNSAEIEETK